MKVKDADILVIPGFKNAGPAHWQSRWEQKLSTARRVRQDEWQKPVLEDWMETTTATVRAADRPVVLVAHSLGVAAAVHATAEVGERVAGAFLVAPPEVENETIRPRHLMTFGPYPRAPLPFPSVTVASRNDPFSGFAAAEDIAAAWGSLFLDAGHAGHIDDESGYGPWPEGSMAFATFMGRL